MSLGEPLGIVDWDSLRLPWVSLGVPWGFSLGSLRILADPFGFIGTPVGSLVVSRGSPGISGRCLGVPGGYLWESLLVPLGSLGVPWGSLGVFGRSPGRSLGYLGGALGSLGLPVETPRFA